MKYPGYASSPSAKAKELVKNDYISRTDYDKKHSAYLVSQANLSTAKKNLSDARLIAPFSGIVAKKYVKKFENVKAKQNILLLQFIAKLDVEINVPEYIILNLRRDEKAERYPVAMFEGAPGKQYPLTFKEFSSEADPETQTYRVLFTMTSPKDITVYPGMTVTVKAPIPDLKDGSKPFILIPSSAVFDGPDKKTSVWVINMESMTVTRVPVEVTRLENGNVRLLSGLKTGQRIVVAGVHFLQDQQKVKIMKPLPGSNDQ